MNKKVRKYRKIDEHSFNAVKTLISTGLTGREIQRAMNISQSTFWRIKKAEDLDEYRAFVLQKNTSSETEGEKVAEQIAEAARASVEINFTEAQAEIVIEILNKILEKVSLVADNTKPKGFFR